MNIFLDIEETFLESIDNPRILLENVNRIKMRVGVRDSITIFSFALWEPMDLTNDLKEIIENLFGEFRVVFKNDIRPLFSSLFGITNDLDFMDFSNNKETVFLLWIKDQILKGNIKEDCLFIDDRIKNFTVAFNGISVEFVNVLSV